MRIMVCIITPSMSFSERSSDNLRVSPEMPRDASRVKPDKTPSQTVKNKLQQGSACARVARMSRKYCHK